MLLDVLRQLGHHATGGLVLIAAQDVEQTVIAELVLLCILGLVQSIGIDEKALPMTLSISSCS